MKISVSAMTKSSKSTGCPDSYFLLTLFISSDLYNSNFRLHEKLKQKRLEREEQEKKEQIAREKQRRAHGKDMTSTKEK